MPVRLIPIVDESLTDLAARVLGDDTLFRDVAALNDISNPFDFSQSAIARDEILVPLTNEITGLAQPALTSVRTGVESAIALSAPVQKAIENYTPLLEDLGLQELSAEINGVFGPIKNGLTSAQETVERYGEATGIQLIGWLLD